MVEKYLIDLPSSENSGIKAIVWITHSEEQAAHVATRRLRIVEGKVEEG